MKLSVPVHNFYALDHSTCAALEVDSSGTFLFAGLKLGRTLEFSISPR
jgi:hypothetical protein